VHDETIHPIREVLGIVPSGHFDRLRGVLAVRGRRIRVAAVGAYRPICPKQELVRV
jgi:hypothetical protein